MWSFILFCVLAFILYSLHRKYEGLRDRVERLEREQGIGRATPQVTPLSPAPLNGLSPLPERPVLREDNGPNPLEAFFHWITVDWPMKLGAFLILLGFGWLTTYAFLNNWIGPAGRITLGMFAGIAIMLLGNWRMARSRAQGAVLIGLGSTVFLMTTFAAREVYDFFTPAAALAIMGLVAFFVGVASWKHTSLSLAVIGILSGSIAPLLTNSPEPSFSGLFSYLFVLSLGIVWLASIRSWRVLMILSLLIVSAYSAPWFANGVPEADMTAAAIFATLFGLLYYAVGLLTMVRAKEKSIADMVVAGANALFILLWIVAIAPDHLESIITTAVALLFAAAAFALFRMTEEKSLFFVYAGAAVGLLGAATALELEGAALIIAYTVEAGLLSLIAAQVLSNYKLGARLGLFLGLPVLLSGESMDSFAWTRGVLHEDFFVLLLLSLTFLLLGWTFNAARTRVFPEPEHILVRIFTAAGLFYWFVLLWLSIHAGVEDQTTARMITLIAYTLFGIAFYLIGMNRRMRGIQLSGEVLFGFIVLDLLFVEIWHMTLAGKIVTFLLIGTLLISTIFLRKGNKEEIQEHV